MTDLLLPSDAGFPRSPDQYHQNSDVDSSVFAFHHTLGPKAHQAAPGNHKHRGTNEIVGGDTGWIALPFNAAWGNFSTPLYA